jgi:hypothetical protein
MPSATYRTASAANSKTRSRPSTNSSPGPIRRASAPDKEKIKTLMAKLRAMMPIKSPGPKGLPPTRPTNRMQTAAAPGPASTRRAITTNKVRNAEISSKMFVAGYRLLLRRRIMASSLLDFLL